MARKSKRTTKAGKRRLNLRMAADNGKRLARIPDLSTGYITLGKNVRVVKVAESKITLQCP